MVAGTHDTITLTDLELAAYERALQPKRLVTIAGGHFDPYLSQFAVPARPPSTGSRNTWADPPTIATKEPTCIPCNFTSTTTSPPSSWTTRRRTASATR
jgi:fermentation-respiration switch protein FrsA (DUF1100 family)